MTAPAGRLIALLAHGSPDPRSSAAAHDLAVRVQQELTADTVAACFLDHDAPSLAALVRQHEPSHVIVVPLFLSSAFHLTVDVPLAIEAAREHCTDIACAAPLAHDPRLRRWLDAQLPTGIPVVMATAGTRNTQAQAELAKVAIDWATERTTEVVLSYAAMAEPSVTDAMFATKEPLAVASYVLFPGVIDDRIREAAAGRPVSRPLGECPVLVEIIRDRIIEAIDLPR